MMSPVPTSIRMDRPTALIDFQVEGHAGPAPRSRADSARKTPSTKPGNSPNTGTAKNPTIASNVPKTMVRVGTPDLAS